MLNLYLQVLRKELHLELKTLIFANCVLYCLSPKFKRVSLDKTLEFPFWGLNICVDFDLRDSKKGECKQTEKIIFHYKNIDIHKTVSKKETREFYLTIYYFKFLALGAI